MKSAESNKTNNNPIFSSNDIRKLLNKTNPNFSQICCGIYGFDGTGKSGIALDCRSEQDKKQKKKLLIIDLDGGSAPLISTYYSNDKDIKYINPMMMKHDEKGKLVADYDLTYEKIRSIIYYIDSHLAELNLKAIIFDGVDKFLKICEYMMRDQIDKLITDGVDFRYWKIRNKRFYDVIEAIKLINCDKYFITHLKIVTKKEKIAGVKVEKKVEKIGWQTRMPNILFQKIKCYREEKETNEEKMIYLKAKIEKSKTNLNLEGKEFIIAKTKHNIETNKSKSKWYGLKINEKIKEENK